MDSLDLRLLQVSQKKLTDPQLAATDGSLPQTSQENVTFHFVKQFWHV
jgi:hypothetical protein